MNKNLLLVGFGLVSLSVNGQNVGGNPLSELNAEYVEVVFTCFEAGEITSIMGYDTINPEGCTITLNYGQLEHSIIDFYQWIASNGYQPWYEPTKRKPQGVFIGWYETLRITSLDGLICDEKNNVMFFPNYIKAFNFLTSYGYKLQDTFEVKGKGNGYKYIFLMNHVDYNEIPVIVATCDK
jgi:hypothetical protein